jgi:hypothetical protein
MTFDHSITLKREKGEGMWVKGRRVKGDDEGRREKRNEG